MSAEWDPLRSGGKGGATLAFPGGTPVLERGIPITPGCGNQWGLHPREKRGSGRWRRNALKGPVRTFPHKLTHSKLQAQGQQLRKEQAHRRRTKLTNSGWKFTGGFSTLQGNTKDLYSQNNLENKDQSWRIYSSLFQELH